MTDNTIATPAPEREDHPDARREWFTHRRLGEGAGNPDGRAYLRALEAKRALLAEGAGAGDEPGLAPGGTGSYNWTPLGPSVIGEVNADRNWAFAGRITAIAPGPGNTRIYAGAADGGVWRSGDAGVTWAPIDDYVTTVGTPVGFGGSDALSIGCLHVTFGPAAANDDIWIGTGEGDSSADIYGGIGIRHSPSGGAPGTWATEATNLAGSRIGAIVVDPDNSANVYAQSFNGIFKRPTSGSAANWTPVTSPNFPSTSTNPPMSMIVVGSGATKRYYAAFYNDRVYSSPDGATWTPVAGMTGGRRIALAGAPSDPTVVYAFRADGGLFRLTSGTFQPVAGLPANAPFWGGQGDYDIAIAVHPTDPNTVVLGGDILAVWKGTITGGPGTWTFPFNAANNANPQNDPTYVGQNVHSDCHFITYGRNATGAGDPNVVWAGTDGGIFLSTGGANANTFHPSAVGLAVTQMTYLAQHPVTSAVVLAGTQDNGTNRCDGEQTWWTAQGGDGGGVAIDPNNPLRVMRQYIGASLDRNTTDGGLTFAGWSGVSALPPAGQPEGNPRNGRVSFYSPIVTSPAGSSPTRVFFGTSRLWMSPDWGSTWVTLPTGTTAAAGDTQDEIDGQPIVAIAVASATRVYAATYRTIWRYDLAGTTWSRTVLPTTGLPTGSFGYYISALAVDDAAAGTLYAAQSYTGVPHLYHFDGVQWTVALPLASPGIDSPASAVAVDPADPSMVYVGTDVGVWQLRKTGTATWNVAIFSAGLPEAAVLDLAIHAPTRLLRAATHGRGVWEVDLSGPAGTASPELYVRVNTVDDGRLVGGARRSYVEGAADPLRPGFTVYHWMSPDIKVRRSSIPTPSPLAVPVDHFDFATRIDDYIDSTDVETIDVSGADRMFVEVHNRAYTPVPASSVRVCVLLADASAGLPPLPADYATHIRNGDTSNWPAISSDPARTGFSGWWFADPANPYRTPPRDVDVRTPGVVEYSAVDLATLNPPLPSGHDHVCAAVFVTAPSDALTATEPSLDVLTMHERRVAHRNLHVVPAGATPVQDGGYEQQAQTVVVDFHNTSGETQHIDLVFDHRRLMAPLFVGLPNHPKIDVGELKKESLKVIAKSALPAIHAKALEAWSAGKAAFLKRSEDRVAINPARDRWRLDKLGTLGRLHLLEAERGALEPAIVHGLMLEPGKTLSVPMVVAAPDTARPGEHYEFTVMQRSGDRIVGGSTYVLAVYDASKKVGEPR